MNTTTIIAPLVILLSSLFFGSTPQDQAKSTADKKFVLDAGEHELVAVIEASGKFLDRTYLLAPTELPAESPKVKLPRRLELDAAGCEAVVSQIAFTHDLIATPLDRGRGLWEFVNLTGPRRADAMARAIILTPAEVRRMRGVRVVVTTQVTVLHARATVVTQTLRPFFAGAGGAGSFLSLGTAGNEHVILLQGVADTVAQVLDTIAEVDQPQPLSKIEDDRLTLLEKRMRAVEEALKGIESKPK